MKNVIIALLCVMAMVACKKDKSTQVDILTPTEQKQQDSVRFYNTMRSCGFIVGGVYIINMGVARVNDTFSVNSDSSINERYLGQSHHFKIWVDSFTYHGITHFGFGDKYDTALSDSMSHITIRTLLYRNGGDSCYISGDTSNLKLNFRKFVYNIEQIH